MIDFYTRTRQRGAGACSCGCPILVGERYVEMVAMDTDLFDKPFVRRTWHEGCAPSDIHGAREAKARTTRAAFDYIEKRYGRRFHVGQRVGTETKLGTVVDADGGYLVVRLQGHRHGAYHHPMEVACHPGEMTAKPVALAELEAS